MAAAAPLRSFAARVASASSNTTRIESWDDGDFEDDHAAATADGLLFKNSASLHSLSSRMSVRSDAESVDDWQFLITPNDELATTQAVTAAAKQAGIPIPASVPSSALLGGSIKRLGNKKQSARKMHVDDDWANDLELPGGLLTLKPPVVINANTTSNNTTTTTTNPTADDDLDWGEGSLGIRFAGTRRDARGARSSSVSVSAMSPSLGSCMTMESDDDDLNGIILPFEPLDFNARLEKLKKAQQQLPTPENSPRPPLPLPIPTSAPAPSRQHPFDSPDAPPPSKPLPTPTSAADDDDFMQGLDFGEGEVFDDRKLTLNRNVVVKKKASAKSTAPTAARPASTLTFTDRPTTSRIPRPQPVSVRSRLTPVYESGAPTHGASRPMPTTTSAQLLRSKRSAPLLRNSNLSQGTPRMPFLPAGGNTTTQSHNIMARSSQGHLRRDSDPRRPQSPSMRSHSRLSGHQSETPSRTGVRRDLAPALARHPAPKKLTQPQRKRNFGDGHELDSFDDLPTSATKEKAFIKAPRNTASNKTLRQQPSNSRLPMPDRMATPQPHAPLSPPRPDHTPRFARDTAASRNAREQRLNDQRMAGTRSRAEGTVTARPMSWQAQVAARSPHSSPTAHRKRGSGAKPQLIRQMTQPSTHNEKGMIYNPTLQRWEGNEEALVSFHHPNTSTTTLALTTASTPTFAPPGHPNRSHDRSQSISHIALSSIQAAQKSFSSRAARMAAPATPAPAPSPPRPALISQISVPRAVQYEGRMVFDPVKMTWLKAARPSNDPRSPSELDDDEDPFAGMDDLKDNESVLGGNNADRTGTPNPSEVGEEFDVGPGFIRRQREEELVWRRRVDTWVGDIRDTGEHRGGWRWAIRDFAASASAGSSGF